MRYGAMDGSLGRGARPADTVIPVARQAGLDGVELCLRADYADDPLWSPSRARETAATARAEGIDIPSLTLLMLNQGSFAGPADVRERARDVVRHGVDLAAALGARVILLPFFGAGKIADDLGVAQVIEDLRLLAPSALSAGVTLAIETTLPAPQVVEILRAVDSPSVSNYFDLANAVWLGYDVVREMETLAAASALRQVHVKDVRERPGDCDPGDGRVPYPAAMDAAKRLGYDGYLILETQPTDDPVAAARRHVAFVRGLLNR